MIKSRSPLLVPSSSLVVSNNCPFRYRIDYDYSIDYQPTSLTLSTPSHTRIEHRQTSIFPLLSLAPRPVRHGYIARVTRVILSLLSTPLFRTTSFTPSRSINHPPVDWVRDCVTGRSPPFCHFSSLSLSWFQWQQGFSTFGSFLSRTTSTETFQCRGDPLHRVWRE